MRFGSSNINSLLPSAANIKTALESLTSTNRLDASAIKNLPAGGTSSIVGTYGWGPIELIKPAGSQTFTNVISHSFAAGTFQPGDMIQMFLSAGARVAQGGATAGFRGYIVANTASSTNRWVDSAFQTGGINSNNNLFFLAGNQILHYDGIPTSYARGTALPGIISHDFTNNVTPLIVEAVLPTAASTWWINRLVVIHYRPSAL